MLSGKSTQWIEWNKSNESHKFITKRHLPSFLPSQHISGHRTSEYSQGKERNSEFLPPPPPPRPKTGTAPETWMRVFCDPIVKAQISKWKLRTFPFSGRVNYCCRYNISYLERLLLTTCIFPSVILAILAARLNIRKILFRFMCNSLLWSKLASHTSAESVLVNSCISPFKIWKQKTVRYLRLHQTDLPISTYLHLQMPWKQFILRCANMWWCQSCLDRTSWPNWRKTDDPFEKADCMGDIALLECGRLDSTRLLLQDTSTFQEQ